MKTILLSLFMMLCLGVHRSSSEILQRHKRNWIIDSFVIDEGYVGAFPYTLGRIEIEKNLTIFKIHGEGVDIEPEGILQIDEYTGVITVHKPVDYEFKPYLKLTFQALDRTNRVVDTQLGIEIKIEDANDNDPKFDQERYEISVRESQSQETEVITLQASDKDSGKNGIFDFKMVSVSPKPGPDLAFYLTRISGTGIGTISFRGCLDHEKADKYTIIVEAKDQAEKKHRSSSCTVIVNIEDGNNHLPVITGHTGSGTVKEGQTNVLVARLQVRDEDGKGSPAWRAKYTIHDNTNNIFRITTDPETNEGLLYVEKHLDYEDSSTKKLTISVDNEIPYNLCKVVSRSSVTDVWVVTHSSTITSSATGAEKGSSMYQVTVTVEDVNEPPVFDTSNKHVKVYENVKVGLHLETFTARDPDFNSGNTFVYRKGEDPADWVTVDLKTGTITTSNIVDRESTFVKNNMYNATIYAVDNGKPPMTGTATLHIQIIDENDNTPTLAVSAIDMCISDGPSLANIIVLDLDEDPYGGPYNIKLREDFGGKWKVDSSKGYLVKLTKEEAVHSGHYDLVLEVRSLQGETTPLNLSVTVCSCINTEKPNCRTRKVTSSTVGGGAFGIFFVSLLLLAGVLLLAFLLSCKKRDIEIPDDSSGYLMKCNTETLGSDCEVDLEQLNHCNVKIISLTPQVPQTTVKQSNIKTTNAAASLAHSECTMTGVRRNNLQWLVTDTEYGSSRVYTDCPPFQTKSSMEQGFTRGNSMRWSLGTSTARIKRHESRNSTCKIGGKDSIYYADLHKVIKKKLSTLQARGEELGDYAPHVYADEEETVIIPELDAISIYDIAFDPDLDLDLNSKFNTLASICMPGENTVNSTTTWIRENQHYDPRGKPEN